MSQVELSSAPARRRAFWLRLVGLTAPLVIVGLFMGPRGIAGMAALGGSTGWIPHAPNIALLASAPPAILFHLATIAGAMVLGAVLLIGKKGKTMHRVLGWTFVLFMLTTAIDSFFIFGRSGFHPNLLHLFSIWTLIGVPIAVLAARRHNVRLHRRMMRGFYIGAIVIAGALTFMPGRLMWRVFFG